MSKVVRISNDEPPTLDGSFELLVFVFCYQLASSTVFEKNIDLKIANWKGDGAKSVILSTAECLLLFVSHY